MTMSESSLSHGGAAPAESRGRWGDALREEIAYQRVSNPIETMPSCLNMFDDWAMCFALGKQFRHVYRYGTHNNCTAKMDSFKFCMSLKGMSEEERYNAWIQRRAELVVSKRLTQSSEDIWQSRGGALFLQASPEEAPKKRGWFS